MIKKLSLVFMMLFALTLVSCSSKDDEKTINYPKTYGIVEVLSGERTDDGILLTLETDGFNATTPIKVEVTIKDGAIIKYEVIEHNESTTWGKALIDSGDLAQAFIDHSGSLNSLDLEDYLDSSASATITAEALLDIALAALQHYTDDYK